MEGGTCGWKELARTEAKQRKEDTIIERIEDAASKTPFVIVDLEGTASKIVVYAISDPVIIPTQGSQLDANEADPRRNAKPEDDKERNALPTRGRSLRGLLGLRKSSTFFLNQRDGIYHANHAR